MVEHHKLWPEQCRAALIIQKNLGIPQALHYLVGEKFVEFVRESARQAPFAAELASFAAEVRRMFTHDDLDVFLQKLEANPPRRADGDPVWAAEEVLAIQKAHQLLA